MATPVLTYVDQFTQWPEALFIADIIAETGARAFITTLVTCFGTPSTIATYRDRQFESNLWHSFTTTAYHPCANGLVEHLHRQLKAALKGHPQQGNWTEALPLVLLGIRISLKEDFSCTAAELAYGTSLRLPCSFFSPTTHSNPDPQNYVHNLQNRMRSLQATPPHLVPHTPQPSNEILWNSSYVFIRHDGVRKPIQPPYKRHF